MEPPVHPASRPAAAPTPISWRRLAAGQAPARASPARSWAGHPPGPTGSPGGRPLDRSVSRASCRITTAATWSTTAPTLALPDPGAPQRLVRAHRAQPLVDQAHRHRRHECGQAPGVVPSRSRGRAVATGERARQADHDLDRLRGRGPARPATAGPRRPSRSRAKVVTGVASTPPGSLDATPTRTVPTSTPIRTPGLTSWASRGWPSRAAGHRFTDRVLQPRRGPRRPCSGRCRRPGRCRPCRPRRRP